MGPKLRKSLEILFVLLVAALSVGIFLFRDRLQELGTVGYVGLFFLCFLANSTVFVPSPSLMIAASCALILNPVAVAAVAALGSSLGEFTGYGLGKVAQDLSPRFQRLLELLTRRIPNDTLLVFLLALLPLPLFDVAGVYSGGRRMAPLRFFLACYGGKFLKTLCYTRAYDVLAWLQSVSGIALPIP